MLKKKAKSCQRSLSNLSQWFIQLFQKFFYLKFSSAKLKESFMFAMSYLQPTVPWVLVEIKLQEMDWIRHGNFVKLTTSSMMVLLCATGTALNLLGNGQPGKLAFAQCSGLLRNLSNFFTTSISCRHTGIIGSKSFHNYAFRGCISMKTLKLWIHISTDIKTHF